MGGVDLLAGRAYYGEPWEPDGLRAVSGVVVRKGTAAGRNGGEVAVISLRTGDGQLYKVAGQWAVLNSLLAKVSVRQHATITYLGMRTSGSSGRQYRDFSCTTSAPPS